MTKTTFSDGKCHCDEEVDVVMASIDISMAYTVSALRKVKVPPRKRHFRVRTRKFQAEIGIYMLEIAKNEADDAIDGAEIANARGNSKK